MDQPKTRFAANLKFLRKSRQLSQVKLAEALGIKRNAVTTYESGFSEPRLSVLLKIADYFQVSVNELLTSTTETIGVSIIKDNSTIVEVLPHEKEIKKFLKSTNDAQTMLDGFDAYNELLEVDKGSNSVVGQEIDRLNTILRQILQHNWTLINSLQDDSYTPDQKEK